MRDVVVLPLVPVTATTGTRGRRRVGGAPGSTRRTPSAARDTAAATSPSGRASSTAATPCARGIRPSPPVPGVGHDESDAGRRSAGCVQRGGSCPPRRRCDARCRATTLAAKRCRRPVSGRPVEPPPGPGRVRRPGPPPRPGPAGRGQVERELDRGPREVEVRAVQHPELDQRGPTGRRWSRSLGSPWRGSHRRRARSPPVVAGNQSESSATQAAQPGRSRRCPTSAGRS